MTSDIPCMRRMTEGPIAEVTMMTMRTEGHTA